MTRLDPRLTFDTFVVGPANRLAAAAARRAADSPGESYNPLFLYSHSGLGKSHILSAMAHQATRTTPDRRVVFTTLEAYLDDLTRDLASGGRDAMRDGYRGADFLLLDDVQFLTDQPQAQELLLRTLDTLTGEGKQVVLASDRPPAAINGLDERLVSRFSGGLILDIGRPEYETRVAIVRRKAEQRGGELAAGVAEMMARIPFRNIRELQGALNRILAIQELEERRVEPEEVRVLLHVDERTASGDEVPSEPADSPPPPPPPTWRERLREAAVAAEDEGFVALRLRRLLEAGDEPDDLEGVLERFARDLERVRTVTAEVAALGIDWTGTGPSPLLDPDRLDEVEAWLPSARQRARPFPPLPPGPDLSGLRDVLPRLALHAAEGMLAGDEVDVNPLFVVAPDPRAGRVMLEAMARTFVQKRPGVRVGLVSVPIFAEEFIDALSTGTSTAWRERWGTADLLLLEGAEGLSRTERVQDEFFHAFEGVKGRGGRIVISADRAPRAIEGIHDRLRTRFEGGLVVELAGGGAAAPGGSSPPEVAEVGRNATVLEGVGPSVPEVAGSSVPGAPSPPERWVPSGEKVVWVWPRLDDRLVEEVD